MLGLGLCLTPTARADKRLDQAVAKAEAQLAKGKEDEAVKVLQKAASQATGRRRGPARAGADAGAGGEAGRGGARVRGGRRACRRPLRRRAGARARGSLGLRAAGRHDTGRARLRAAGRRGRGRRRGQAALARALARRGDARGAQRPPRAPPRPRPTRPRPSLARGDAYLAQRLGEQAEAVLPPRARAAARSVEAATGLALALAAQGKAAAGRWRPPAPPFSWTRDSGEAEAALGLAALAQDPTDKAGEAVAAVQQARFLEPESALVRLALGRVFESRGQLEQAASAYAEAARLDPSWAAPRVAALELRLREGDADGALAELRALPQELRASGDAQLLLGKLLLRKGDARAAEAALDLAVEALPGSAEAWAAFGRRRLRVRRPGPGRERSRARREARPRRSRLSLELRALSLVRRSPRAGALGAARRRRRRAEGKTADAFLTLGSDLSQLRATPRRRWRWRPIRRR